jgi:hypothetical protein
MMEMFILRNERERERERERGGGFTNEKRKGFRQCVLLLCFIVTKYNHNYTRKQGVCCLEEFG